jgi:hypothetical protein
MAGERRRRGFPWFGHKGTNTLQMLVVCKNRMDLVLLTIILFVWGMHDGDVNLSGVCCL